MVGLWHLEENQDASKACGYPDGHMTHLLQDLPQTAVRILVSLAGMSVQEEAQLMARMESSGAAPPDSSAEDTVSKPAQQGGSLANGAAAKKVSGLDAGQAPARDTGQGEDLVQRLTQVIHRWLYNTRPGHDRQDHTSVPSRAAPRA